MSKPLSGPHQKFAEGIASGLNQTEAYLAAYPKSSEESSRRAASALMTNLDILSEIERLKERVEKQFTMTRVEWLESYSRIAKQAEMSADYSAAKACLREIGLAMPGWYSPADVKLTSESVVKVIIGT